LCGFNFDFGLYMFPYFLTTMAKNWKDGGWGALVKRVDNIRAFEGIYNLMAVLDYIANKLIIQIQAVDFGDVDGAKPLLVSEIQTALQTAKKSADPLKNFKTGLTSINIDSAIDTSASQITTKNVNFFDQKIKALSDMLIKTLGGDSIDPFFNLRQSLKEVMIKIISEEFNAINTTTPPLPVSQVNYLPPAGLHDLPNPVNNQTPHLVVNEAEVAKEIADKVEAAVAKQIAETAATAKEFADKVEVAVANQIAQKEAAHQITKKVELAVARRMADRETVEAAATIQMKAKEAEDKKIADRVAAKQIADAEAAATIQMKAKEAEDKKIADRVAAKQIADAEAEDKKQKAAAMKQKAAEDAEAKKQKAADKKQKADEDAEAKKQKAAAMKQKAAEDAEAKKQKAAAMKQKEDAEAAAAKKQKEDAAAAAAKKQKDDAAAAAKKQKEDAAAAAKKQKDDAAAAAKKQKEDEVEAAKKQKKDATAAKPIARPASARPVSARPVSAGKKRG
jgi:hypothetical protein